MSSSYRGLSIQLPNEEGLLVIPGRHKGLQTSLRSRKGSLEHSILSFFSRKPFLVFRPYLLIEDHLWRYHILTIRALMGVAVQGEWRFLPTEPWLTVPTMYSCHWGMHLPNPHPSLFIPASKATLHGQETEHFQLFPHSLFLPSAITAIWLEVLGNPKCLVAPAESVGVVEECWRKVPSMPRQGTSHWKTRPREQNPSLPCTHCILRAGLGVSHRSFW